MTIDVPQDVALRLEELAKRKDSNIGELLRDLLERYEDERDDKARRRPTTADFARNASAAGLASPHPVDTAERSREILHTEFADYLKRRANR